MKHTLFTCLIFLFTTQLTSKEFPDIISYPEIRGSAIIKKINSFTNGDLILIGENTPKGEKKKNIFIIKTNKTGDIIWKKEFFSERVLAINDFLIDSNNNIIIAAEQYEEGNRESLFLLGLNADGEKLFSQHYNEGNGEIEAYDIEIDKNGGFLITGFCKISEIISNSFFNMMKEDQFLYLLKINSLGEKIWSKYIKEDYYEASGNKIIIDDNSYTNIFSNNHKNNKENRIKLITSVENKEFHEYELLTKKNAILSDVLYHDTDFYLTGILINREASKDNYDIFVMKINKNYKTIFSKIIKTNNNDWATGIEIKEDGNIILFGQIKKDNKKQISLIELNQKGSLLSVKTSNYSEQHISITDGANIKNQILLTGSHWKGKKTSIIINGNSLNNNEENIQVKDGDFNFQKLRKDNYINLTKKEIISPVNIQEWKY
tara:strand:- start:12773 stop:14071 length:1299 start_codon:yes stop_codon:yes gene_type:complete